MLIKDKYNVCFIAIVTAYFLVFIYTCNDPFYGDSKSTISRLAVSVYQNNFSNVFYPKGIDPGHPIFIPLMHASLWKIFGLDLFWSHLFNFIASLAVLFLVKKIDSFYGFKNILLLLIAFNPIFLALSISLNTHIFLFLFTLSLLWSNLNNNLWGIIASLALLLLIHNEGLVIVFAFLGTYLLMAKREKKLIYDILRLSTAFIPYCAWLIWHKWAVGWYIFPPEYSDFRGIGTSLVLLKNAGIIIWRLIDFGCFIILVFAFLWLSKNKNDKRWLFYACFSILLVLGIWLTVKFSIAHRYFIPVFFVLSILSAAFLLEKSKKWLFISLFLLFSGNFWYYPGKQLSDANILFRHYYHLYAQISKSEFANLNLYAMPPNESSFEFTHLKKPANVLATHSISSVKLLDSSVAIIDGNLNGILPNDVLKKIVNWPSYTFTSGAAWYTIYVHPSAVKSNVKFWPQRISSTLELQLTQWKNKLK